ncbi:MAG: ABC transporter permease [Candidatus Omnitrophica bacterium]|nr:ABC transporter permease [Candidatus Omnitrophota bacterium]
MNENLSLLKPLSPLQMALKRLKRNPIAVTAFFILVALYLTAIFADFIAPYNYDNEDRLRSYNPPTRIHFFDEKGKFHLRPFVYDYGFEFNEFYRRIYIENKAKRYPIKLLRHGDHYKLLWLIPSDLHLFGVDGPARLYLLGADSRGRDLFSRILYGSRISLSIGLVGVAISFVIGTMLGGISGYFGGKVDNIIMRLCEMVMMIPGFYLMLALRAAFPPKLSSAQVYLLIVVIMSFIGWAGLARVVRGMSMSIREKEFVLAAKGLGANPLYIVSKHVLPNTLSYTIVALSLSVPGYILGESALSLLGLGIQDPHASWGNLLSEAMGIAQIQFHPWILIPGFFIFITVMAFNFLGDGLRDAFDPTMEVGRKL